MKINLNKIVAKMLFGNPVSEWFYWHYFMQFGSGGNPKNVGNNFRVRRYYIAEAMWDYMCGSYYSDLAVRNFLRAFGFKIPFGTPEQIKYWNSITSNKSNKDKE